MNNMNKNQNYRKMNLCTNVDNIEIPQNIPVNTLQESEVFTNKYIQGILQEAEGYYVIIEFLIGTQSIVEKQGYITDVGVNYVTLYNPESGLFILCDMYSIKFVNFTDYRNPEHVEEFQRKIRERKTK